MFEELENKVKHIEDNVKERVDVLKERIVESEVKKVQQEVTEGPGNDVIVGSEDETKNTVTKKNNVIIYRVKEIDSVVADDREAGDMLFVHELCHDALKVDIESGDIEKMFRLRRREEGRGGER